MPGVRRRAETRRNARLRGAGLQRTDRHRGRTRGPHLLGCVRLAVADIAARAAKSTRTLTRRFRAQTGTTPLQWLLGRRLQRVGELLETTDLPMSRVAGRAGLGSPETLRHHFSRCVGTTRPRASCSGPGLRYGLRLPGAASPAGARR
ncbi:helix-turn-helix domain-containing protein [Streptomyces wuyuanensis]|uniref:helix-turn-helix domain-containing protein n=1 Tax=Streptomyces wuyuanensis TaxID=1196353 RepID=UPI003D737655